MAAVLIVLEVRIDGPAVIVVAERVTVAVMILVVFGSVLLQTPLLVFYFERDSY